MLPAETITNKIYYIRKVKVMLDRDLAAIYGIETKRLKEQVRRNIERFPDDFMFELTKNEFEILRSQFATSSWGGLEILIVSPSAKKKHNLCISVQIRVQKKLNEIFVAFISSGQ